MAISTGERETILRTVAAWPREDQVALARAILHRATTLGAMTPQRPSWRQMVGLAAQGRPAPSDDEVARWLDEHRSEKYG
jgi:hypothetical protein